MFPWCLFIGTGLIGGAKPLYSGYLGDGSPCMVNESGASTLLRFLSAIQIYMCTKGGLPFPFRVVLKIRYATVLEPKEEHPRKKPTPPGIMKESQVLSSFAEAFSISSHAAAPRIQAAILLDISPKALGGCHRGLSQRKASRLKKQPKFVDKLKLYRERQKDEP